MKVYFDNAATTAIDVQVLDLQYELQRKYYGNASSIHQLGRETKVIIENARTTVARLLNVSPSEIFFTSGGTESINTLVAGVVNQLKPLSIITSKIEHPAMLQSLTTQAHQSGCVLQFLEINAKGIINLDHLESLLQSWNGAQVLISLMHVNNELGNLLPLKKVSELAQKYHALFMCDTVQSIGKYPLDLGAISVDFAVGSAHKFHGPKGIGLMYINRKNAIAPLLLGGTQERNMRAGTENFANIAALAKALELAYSDMENHLNHVQQLKKHLIDRITAELPNITFNGNTEGFPYILNLGIPKTEHNEMILMNLDIQGIYLSGGSACSSGTLKPSHVMEALGLAERCRPLRVSFSKYNTLEEVDYLVDVLKKY
jgi:cysteine desulfurase